MKFIDSFFSSLRALLTEHLLAKFFALIFAVVIVYLIDRELRSVWINDEDVVVVEKEMFDTTRDQKFAVVLEPEAGVVILRKPEFLRLRVKGPDRLRREFERRRAIVVKVKRSWTSSSPEARDYQLEARDLDFGVTSPDLEVFVLGEPRDRQVRVDLFEEAPNIDVDVGDPKKRPVGYEYKPEANVLEPKSVVLRGPRQNLRTLLQGLPSGKLRLELEEPEVALSPTIAYTAHLSTATRDKRITMTPPVINAKLGYEEIVAAVPRTLEGVPIEIRLAREDVQEIQAGRLLVEFETVKMVCAVQMSVAQELARKPDFAESMRKMLVAEIDIGALLKDGQADPGRAAVRVRGEPVGVKIEKVDPSTVPLKITRKQK